jgi:hypothetical protein
MILLGDCRDRMREMDAESVEIREWLYRWAGTRSRSDSPNIADLKAEGWIIEHIDPRYGTTLMRKAVNRE